MRLWLFAALVGCRSTSQPLADNHTAAPLATHAEPPARQESSNVPAPALPPDCTDVKSDIARRAPDAEPIPESQRIDLDGDRVPDPAFRGFCTMMGGNCDHYLYASGDGCARYVGKVEVTRVTSGPRCADPPSGRTPCRLSASRMMIHGEIYEYFYVYGANGYVEAGVGNKGARPPHGM